MNGVWMRRQKGFTIIELLIVVVVIGVLAAITIVAYGGIQDRARMSKINSDLQNLAGAIESARESTQKTLIQMDGNRSYGSGGAAVPCSSKTAGTDLAALPKTDACWVAYQNTLDVVSAASSTNVRGIVDPWGRPYAIAEMENAPPGECGTDQLSVYALPSNTWSRMPNTTQSIPKSGFSGC